MEKRTTDLVFINVNVAGIHVDIRSDIKCNILATGAEVERMESVIDEHQGILQGGLNNCETRVKFLIGKQIV